MLNHQVEPFPKDPGSFLGCGMLKGLQATLRNANGILDIFSGHLWTASNDVISCRVYDLESRARLGSYPLAIDVGLLAEELGISQLVGDRESGAQYSGF